VVCSGHGACRDRNGVRTISGRPSHIRWNRAGTFLGSGVDVPRPAGVPHSRLETSPAGNHATWMHHSRAHLVRIICRVAPPPKSMQKPVPNYGDVYSPRR